MRRTPSTVEKKEIVLERLARIAEVRILHQVVGGSGTYRQTLSEKEEYPSPRGGKEKKTVKLKS